MARGFTGSFETELAAGSIKPRLFYEADLGAAFGDIPLRLWTGEYVVSWNGSLWQGNGWLHNVSSVKETSNVRAVGARVTLSGVPSELVSLMLQNNLEQGAIGKVWLGFLDSSDAIIADPHLIFAGGLDFPIIQESASVATIDINYESKLIALNKPNVHRYTDEGQRAWFQGDRGFEYTAFLKEWSGYWGKREVVDDG